ncbi:SpoIIE family protein phosphatase [Streptomyces peucetius]|uniref:SpoIIE family protein phosphatase n=1 Tax=Streptomyces peucetius TaxID=1950 RepID=A0ABY6I0F4_STRPE|nr:SpoIIE family protein phosphatase [Streptomyces peucetius]UYQ60321.1 SpoIIE family protein phosphatase [Streptomyces peucetius]
MPARGPAPADSGQREPRTLVLRLSEENTALREELARRHLTDLATGVLAAQLRTSPSEAREYLARLAESASLSLEDIAADLVNGVAGTVAVTAPVALGDTAEEAHGDGFPSHAEARRLRQVVTAAEAADTVGTGAATLLEGGLKPLGVESLWLWQLTGSGCLRLAGHAGGSALEASQWRWIPPAAPAPVRAAFADGAPVWLPAGPPDGEMLPGPSDRAARALVPLRLRGRTTGLALAVWPDSTDLDDRMRAALTGLVEVAARLLGAEPLPPSEEPALDDLLDALVHPAMTLKRDPQTATLLVEHVNGPAGEALGGSQRAVGRPVEAAFPLIHADLDAMSRRAHYASSPQRAARLPAEHGTGSGGPLLDLRVLPAGPDRSVVLWHTYTDRRTAVGRAVGRLQGLALFEDDLATGRSTWTEQTYAIFGMGRGSTPVPLTGLEPRVHPDDTGELAELLTDLLERRKGAAAVVRVVRQDGGLRHVRITAEPLLHGEALSGITGVYHDISAEYHTEVALTATFDQLTAVRAQATLRHRLVLQLQQAIVPEMPAPGQLPGLSAAARYRPAAQEYRVGGDWYDILPLPDGRVMMAVGDIAGHGIDSATGMVALRNTLRGLAFTGHSPGRLMALLNEVTLHTAGHPTATALCAMYDPKGRTLRWASAGHLPILLLRGGTARLLDPPPDILLGAAHSPVYEEATTRLAPGDTLLLYTDGLIERRHDGLDEGLAALRRMAERLPDCEVDGQVDLLLSAATGDTDDDTSLIAVRVR